jgi:hypothetical protein
MDHFEQGRNKIFPLFIHFLRLCYRSESLQMTYSRDQIITLLKMCISSLETLNTNKKRIYNIIKFMGLRYFPRNHSTVYWFVNELLPNYIQPVIYDTDPSTNIDTDSE